VRQDAPYDFFCYRLLHYICFRFVMNNRWLGFLTFLAMLFILSGCCNSLPETHCPIEGLLLGIDDLPGNNWVESGSRSSQGAPMRIGVERIGTSFVGDGLFDGVLHDIYKLENEKSAYHAYEDVVEEEFSTSKYLSEWSSPVELSSLLLSSDVQRIGCNIFIDTGAEECRLLAQYGPYLVRFSIRSHVLKHNDVASLIEDVDRRMVECLSPK